MLRSHRGRLTLVASGSAGLLFLLLFGLSVVGLRHAEMGVAKSELDPAIAQMVVDLRTGPAQLDEVVSSDSMLSMAVYDLRGRLLAHDGRITPPFVDYPGLVEVAGSPVLVRIGRYRGNVVVGSLDWTPHDLIIQRFITTCAMLWLPMVAAVALATWITARATFLPLERLARNAEDMSVEDLSSRLHVETFGEYREFELRLNRFLDRLEASVKREERFLSDAAHELRTPLTVLRGQIETVLSRQRSGAEYRSTLAILAQETARLTSLVELLLRSAAPTQEDSPALDIAEAAERAHARWVDRFSDKQVGLTLAVQPAQATLSDSEFDVIADNLLANSLRASEAGTACSISAAANNGVVLIQVRDQGPGIDSKDAERVFDRFARIDSGRSRQEGGFGIGLALCKRIVEARGGRIWIEPNVPSGCAFHVELRSAN